MEPLFFRFFLFFFFCADIAICRPTNDKIPPSLSNTILCEMDLSDKKLNELNDLELGQLIGRMDERYEALKHLNSVGVLLRRDIEELEILYMPAVELTSDQMLNDLKSQYENFKVPEILAKSHELSIHYLRWRYILKNRLKRFPGALTLRDVLLQSGLPEEAIAKCITFLFESTSNRLHHPVASLKLAEVKKALIASGVHDVNLLNTALAIFAVRRNMEKELEKEICETEYSRIKNA